MARNRLKWWANTFSLLRFCGRSKARLPRNVQGAILRTRSTPSAIDQLAHHDSCKTTAKLLKRATDVVAYAVAFGLGVRLSQSDQMRLSYFADSQDAETMFAMSLDHGIA